jgi:hypothetical protein
MRQLPARFWVESAVTFGTLCLLVVTLASRDWIETVFKVDPDHGSGALEWLIVAACAAVTVSCASLARREWRRAAV